jgi:hypothetical protein
VWYTLYQLSILKLGKIRPFEPFSTRRAAMSLIEPERPSRRHRCL